MDADLRFATSDEDKAAIYRLRYELYVQEQGLFQDVADHERRWLRDADDDRSRLILAEVDGQVVGTMRLLWGAEAPLSPEHREAFLLDRFQGAVEPRDIAVATRVLVRRKYRGGALSFQILWKGCEFAGDNDIELVVADCEPHLVGLYRRLGLRPYGGLYNHPTSGALVRIAIVTGDLAHLRRIGSPLVGALRGRSRGPEIAERLALLLAADGSVLSQETDSGEHWSEITRLLGDGEEGLRGILGELSREEATVLLAKSHILQCEPGDALIRKGHASRTIYMLLSGSLAVHDEGRIVARIERRGAVLGEVAFFTAGRRISDVVAGPDGARVLSLSNGTMREIIASHGPLAAKFLQYVAVGLCEKLVERAQLQA